LGDAFLGGAQVVVDFKDVNGVGGDGGDEVCVIFNAFGNEQGPLCKAFVDLEPSFTCYIVDYFVPLP
jgi:hypothetical protein